MVCYRVIVAPYVRSVGRVFAYLYTLDMLDDNSECPLDYETSLFPKVFPCSITDHSLSCSILGNCLSCSILGNCLSCSILVA